MDDFLKNRLAKSKEIRQKLIDSGESTINIPWEEVERAMIFNYEQQLKSKS